MRAAAVLALAVVALAGCQAPAQTGTTDATTSAAQPGPSFDGEAALGWVKALALRPDGSPRYRIPGTPEHLNASRVLWDALAVEGWARHWHNFTGADYQAAPKPPSLAPYQSACPDAERGQVAAVRFSNLYAVKPGDGSDPRLALLGAHWDSKRDASQDPDAGRKAEPVPAANDGASGVGVLLQLMRDLRNVTLPFDVGVVLLDGEDGFEDCFATAGSIVFAFQKPVTASRFLLLDMVGDPAARFPRESRSVASDPGLVELVWSHGRANGGEANFLDHQRSVLDDHVPFLFAGVPSVDLIDLGRPDTPHGFPPYWHTTQDTVDKLAPSMLGLVGQTVLDTLADPAFAAGWPS